MRTFALPLAALTLLLAACSPSSPENSAPPEQVSASVNTDPDTPAPAPTRIPDPQVEADGAQDEARIGEGGLQDSIPERFHGRWAEAAEHCSTRGHQVYDIAAEEIGFFESTGEVQNVQVNGDYAGATLIEQYGDAPPSEYVFYMALEGPDAMRVRYDEEPRFRIVRCP